jgi:hypothetical protein
MSHRSTSLRAFTDHCPRALDFHEAGAPMLREQFDVGIAAHAVLQQLGEAAVHCGEALPVDEHAACVAPLVEVLITRGRAFDDIPEPPLNPDAVFLGRDIALRWASEHPMGPDARYEFGAAVDKDWKPCDYRDSDARYRAIFDVYFNGEVEDEEAAYKMVVVRDYKTAWPTDAEELDTTQMRGQALLAYALSPGVDCIRQEVVNLRTRETLTRDVFLDEEGLAKLDGWRRDLETLMRAADHKDADGTRPARPGGGCLGCPFILQCRDATDFWADHVMGLGQPTPERVVVAFATAQAHRDALFDLAKAATAEAPIVVHGGLVGTVGVARRESRPEAHTILYKAWCSVGGHAPGAGADDASWREWEAENGRPLGILKSSKLGITQIKAVAKALYPEREDIPLREALVDECTTAVIERRFGVHDPKDATGK